MTAARALCAATPRWLSMRRMMGAVASLGERVADGPESWAYLKLLLELGVSYGQGPLWGLPA